MDFFTQQFAAYCYQSHGAFTVPSLCFRKTTKSLMMPFGGKLWKQKSNSLTISLVENDNFNAIINQINLYFLLII